MCMYDMYISFTISFDKQYCTTFTFGFFFQSDLFLGRRCCDINLRSCQLQGWAAFTAAQLRRPVNVNLSQPTKSGRMHFHLCSP